VFLFIGQMATGLRSQDKSADAVDLDSTYIRYIGVQRAGHFGVDEVHSALVDVETDDNSEWDKESSTRYQLATPYEDPPFVIDRENMNDTRAKDGISVITSVKRNDPRNNQNMGTDGAINDPEFLTNQFEKLGLAIHKIMDRVEQLETTGKMNPVHTPLHRPEWVKETMAVKKGQPVPREFHPVTVATPS